MVAESGNPGTDVETIDALRVFSRQLVRELGYLRSPLADSDLSPSAVHAIIEIGLHPGIQARDLATLLRLDKSNTSRQIAKLEAESILSRVPVAGDARASQLFLTADGEALRVKIDTFGTQQVAKVLARLHGDEQQSLLRFLSLYALTLSQNNPKSDTVYLPVGEIVEGYGQGAVGDIVSLCARNYRGATALSAAFECQVSTELAAFVSALPTSGSGIWRYVERGRTMGAIAVVGDPVAGRARLRWFIVDVALRGAGVGRRLLAQALVFADQHFEQTFAELPGRDAASVHRLYESVGYIVARGGRGGIEDAGDDVRRYTRRAPTHA